MIITKRLTQYDDLEIKEATFRNKTFPTHFHDTYSIGIITNGIENITVNDTNYIALPKSIVIINQNELHSNEFYNEQSWTYKTLNINSNIISYFSKSKDHFQFKNLINDEFLYHLLSGFHSTFEIQAEEKLNKIANYIIHNHLSNKELQNYNQNTEWKIIVEEIIAWMKGNIAEKINIENIAKKYHKSSFQLIRAFRTQTGLTPIAYLLLLRLNNAKTELIEGNSLTQTALSCGFFDQSHFNNYFKRYFGITPKSYQENCTLLINK